MKACTSSVVLGTISKVTEVKDELRIKRKTRSLLGNKLIWWFVIHSDEEILCMLDTEWKKVHAQTGWSLQCCYMPSNNQSGSDNADPQNPPSTNTTSSPSSLSPKPNSQVEQNIAISEESLTGSNAAEDSNEHLAENQPPPVGSQ